MSMKLRRKKIRWQVHFLHFVIAKKCFCCLGRHRCLPHLVCPDRQKCKIEKGSFRVQFENVSLQRTSESNAHVQFSHHFLNAFLTPALNGRRRRKLTAKLSSLYVVTLPCILWKYFSSSPLDFRSGPGAAYLRVAAATKNILFRLFSFSPNIADIDCGLNFMGHNGFLECVGLFLAFLLF